MHDLAFGTEAGNEYDPKVTWRHDGIVCWNNALHSATLAAVKYKWPTMMDSGRYTRDGDEVLQKGRLHYEDYAGLLRRTR